MALDDRFWSKVDIKGLNDCWEWTAYISPKRRGHCRVNGKFMEAHRAVGIDKYGPLPTNVLVRHTCDNTICCNPNHLLIGSAQDNVDDRESRNRGAKGIKNGMAKLTEDQVKDIRDSKLSGPKLARIYNVSDTTIYDIKNKNKWKSL